MSCCNFDIPVHELILTDFGRNITVKVAIKRCFTFQRHLTSAALYTWENRKPGNCACYQEEVGQFEPRFQGEGGRPWGIFFGFYNTRRNLVSDSANFAVLRAVVLTQYRRVTDGQTEGIAVASSLQRLHSGAL